MAMAASSNGVMSGFSRSNVNVGHIGVGESTRKDLYDYNLDFRGPFGKAYPMKTLEKTIIYEWKKVDEAKL